MASLGAGIYTPHAKFSKIGWEHVLANGAVIFIWHLWPNLDLGAGVAVNTSLGYPMVFPAMYINWHLDKKIKVNVSMMNGVELSGGYEFTDQFKLALSFEMNGQMALVKRDGKRMMFNHQYMVVGLKPQVKLGKTGLSLYAMGGLNVYRPAEYSELTLKAMFANRDSYHFRPAPYAAVGIGFGF
jgi:sRNA-binding regulator protein Hfq